MRVLKKHFFAIILILLANNAALGRTPVPKATLTDAPQINLPAHPDSNSPSFWFNGIFHLFISRNDAFLSWGPNYHNLGELIPTPIISKKPGFRWIEGVHQHNGELWALYHLELHSMMCPDRPYFTIPEIGLAKSMDQGRTWQDHGIILKDDVDFESCEQTNNTYFGGGVGDPSWIINESEGTAYILYSSYTGQDRLNQGIQVARIELQHFDNPIGHVWRLTKDGFTAPGLDGHGRSIIPPNISWHDLNVDAFWGPSVHWNIFLKKYVILLNRAIDHEWKQEGVYIVYADQIHNPNTWTEPEKIYDGGRWYVQVLGDPAIQGTDTLAGKISRFFMFGQSDHWLTFEYY